METKICNSFFLTARVLKFQDVLHGAVLGDLWWKPVLGVVCANRNLPARERKEELKHRKKKITPICWPPTLYRPCRYTIFKKLALADFKPTHFQTTVNSGKQDSTWINKSKSKQFRHVPVYFLSPCLMLFWLNLFTDVYGLRGKNSKNKTSRIKPCWRTATHEIQMKFRDNV